MASRLSYLTKNGKKIPFIDLSGLNKLEKSLIHDSSHIDPDKVYHVSLEAHSVSVSYNDPVREALRKGLETAALDFYTRNSTANSTDYQSADISDNNNPIPEYKAHTTVFSNYSSQTTSTSHINYQSNWNYLTNQIYLQQILKQNKVYNPLDNNRLDYAQDIFNSKANYASPADSCCKRGYCFGLCP